MKEKYIQQIQDLLNDCEDESLLDLIFQLLLKSR